MTISRYFLPFYREQETFCYYHTQRFFIGINSGEMKIFLTPVWVALLSSGVASNIIATNLGD